MNTPTHWIFNLAILGSIAPQAKLAITVGAILPDLPIFVFYAVAKGINRLPEAQIWSQAYYQPGWQNLTATFHSIPLAAIGMFACWWGGWHWGAVLFVSAIFHSLLDLPVHHDDAHRHFYPFSDFRYFSPISYWDGRHWGHIVALGEILLVLALTPLLFGSLSSGWLRATVVTIEILYIVGYVRLHLPKLLETISL